MLLAVAGYVVAQMLATGTTGPARCTVRAAAEGDGEAPSYELQPVQASNAATIAAVGASRGLRDRAVTIALATAMQESSLRNISYGDRDSIGLFQQRPSQGWGTKKQIMDPIYSTGKFYEHLVEVPGYSRLPLTVAAQRVQRSGFPQAYAKHERNAALLTAALTGRNAASLHCTTGPGGGDGKAGRADRVQAQLVREFGEKSAPSNTAGPGRKGGSAGGARVSESALTLPATSVRRGWELAHWAMSHSARLRVSEIVYRGHVWSADRSEDGWRKDDGEKRGSRSVLLRLATAD
ncbi:hypothetical protein [Streptomyces sp. AJS327]|uniref:hypothetical protein n=1 Tax=Streptomyces sp. AJS327 TaxID=2545265 RepID=UPI0027E4D205|nr:hypothetical protein [Streptomyces sp. AJS327]